MIYEYTGPVRPGPHCQVYHFVRRDTQPAAWAV